MIQLKHIRLINWYGFSHITVPIGCFTLIAGKNGNGKSVLLDAIKYALFGDTVFNKSSENKGSRTVCTYTRGLLDATAGTYMRPADRMPNVYTHIVLELADPELNRNFILGTAIDTDSGNGFKTQRYVLENKTLHELSHTYEDQGQTLPYSTAQLHTALGVKMMDAKPGLDQFMTRIGLRFNEQQLAAFRRKLRSMMSYNPDAKIDQFIRESVLEEKTVDFSKLVEAKTNIDTLNASFSAIDAEIQELETILGMFDRLQRARNIILADDVKLEYKRFSSCKKALEAAARTMETATMQIAEDQKKLNVLDAREVEVQTAYFEANKNLTLMDCAKAIAAAEEALKRVQHESDRLHQEKTELEAFQERVTKLIAWLCKENFTVADQHILSSLTLDDFSAVQKESSVQHLLSAVKEHRDTLVGRMTRIQDRIKENQKEQSKWQQVIDDCEAKKTTFSEIPTYVGLKAEINQEFQNRGISSEARFACEYVLDLRDEAWRDSIEAYLGKRRYTILVEPEYYDIADQVLNSSKNKYAHLFNTKLLMKKTLTPEPDSVVQFIEVKNAVAKQYFVYQLGRLHATAKDQVKNFENAISKEGRVSVAMDSYFLQFDRLRFYCLGQETLELNRIKAAKNLEALIQEYREQKADFDLEQSKKAYLDTTMKFFSGYHYDAVGQYAASLLDLAKKKEELASLQQAQKNNSEYWELSRRVVELKAELEAIKQECNAVYKDRSNMQTLHDTNQSDHARFSEEIADAKQTLKHFEKINRTIYAKAVDDYERFLANGMSGGTLQDRGRAQRALTEAGDALKRKQGAYNEKKGGENQLPLTDSSRAAYENRKSKIWMDDLQEIRQKLQTQTKRYEEIFKNEFVLTVLKSCESAKNDLKLMNAELARLNFMAKYVFEVKYVKDGTDYEKILEYAHYLKEHEELGTASGQMVLGADAASEQKAAELEADIQNIINRIVASNNQEQIEHYADYRNYMTYEILLTNAVLTNAKLSKQAGYNSGAEVQIPYMLILISALLMIYNDKMSSTRLVFIDEPFAKMDPTNVKIMLRFMGQQNLQIIFCAPDKTELIGNECEVVLPVLRTQPNLMEIGIIDLHKGV